MQIDYLRYGGGSQPATVSGHVVTLHCRDPDDFQFLVGPLQRPSSSTPTHDHTDDAGTGFLRGSLSELNDYLARDEDGNIFLVTGPNSGATALHAMFHP